MSRMGKWGWRRRLLPAAALCAWLPAVTGQAQEIWAPSPPPKPSARRTGAGLSSSGYLGVGVREIDAGRAKELNLGAEYGVEITSLVPDGPAARGGLQRGDVVLNYNGQRVEGVEQFVRMVKETPAGRHVKIQVSRRGSLLAIEVATGARPRFDPVIRPPAIDLYKIPALDLPAALMTWKSGLLGIEAERVDSQLAEFFGVKEGVLVRSVNAGTPAERAGLRAGDVIIRVGTTSVGSPRAITAAVITRPSRKELPITLVRERKEITLNIVMDEEDDADSVAGGAGRIRHVIAVCNDGLNPVF